MGERSLQRGDRVRIRQRQIEPFEGEILAVFQERIEFGGAIRCVFQDELGTVYLSRPSDLEMVQP